jgi:hypothetical protein
VKAKGERRKAKGERALSSALILEKEVYKEYKNYGRKH